MAAQMPPAVSPESWRAVIAALGDPAARAVYAHLALGGSVTDATAALSPSRSRHSLDRLHAAGLITTGPGEDTAIDQTVFARLLSAAPRSPRPTGIERFLRPDGRIDRYPSTASDRAALLAHVSTSTLTVGDVLDERTLGERLLRFTDDPAALRRHLVDAGLIERTPSGSQYTLPGA